MKLTITPNRTTATTDDDTVRVGEEVRFATIEEALTESRRMGERNREALDRAEVEGQPHYWNEQHHRDEHDRIWRVWVKTSFA